VAAGIAALLWLRGSSEVMRIDETDAALVARGRVVYAEA